MGNNQAVEKEEVILAQTAAGAGTNSATVDQLRDHAATTNYILTAICTLIGAVVLVILYKLYRKCHRDWMDQHLREFALKRSASYFRRLQSKPTSEETV